MAMAAQRTMALTADLVARAARVVEDPGPLPGSDYLDGADYDALVRGTLARAPPKGLWVFAYGSLLWKPAFRFAESRPAAVLGWHRAFCIRIVRFRGAPERPGLMMSLDRGGQCRGMVFRLPADEAEAVLHGLFRRELVVKPPTNEPRWLDARTAEGPVRALGFAVNRRGRGYAGRLPLGEAADLVAGAAGHWGSCAEYLRETVAHLEELGIRDRNLWRLQALVAERIAATCALDGDGGPAAARTEPEPGG